MKLDGEERPTMKFDARIEGFPRSLRRVLRVSNHGAVGRSWGAHAEFLDIRRWWRYETMRMTVRLRGDGIYQFL